MVRGELVSTTLLVGVTVGVLAGVTVAVLAGATLAATVSAADQTTTGGKSPNVSSTLLELVGADDREAFAAAHGIELRDGRVVVVVELRGRSTVPEGYDVTAQQTATVDGATFVQATVPVDELVPLSDDPGVAYVRLPDRADPGGNPTVTNGPPERETPSSPAASQPTRQTDVLLVVTVIGVAALAVGLYGRVRR